VSGLIALVRRRSLLSEVIVTFAIALGVIAWSGNVAYHQDLVILTTLYAFIALGIYAPFIMGGGLSMAYNAYLGIGAYSVALIATRTHYPVLSGLLVGVLISAAVAIVLGLSTRKLTAFYLSGVTLLFGTAFADTLIDYPNVTNGAAGISGIKAPSLFGFTLDHNAIVIVSILGVWAIAMMLSVLQRSPFGISLRALKEVPIAVEASGVRTSAVSIAALALGAAIASFGGSIYAVAGQAIFPETLTLDVVFLAVFTPILGGRRSPWGSIIGAVLITFFNFGLNAVADALGIKVIAQTGTLIFSLAVLAFLLLSPNGVMGLVAAGVRRLAAPKAQA
jgi:branched-chain amino acid transport system permease protein